jgi:hypothetical protein
MTFDKGEIRIIGIEVVSNSRCNNFFVIDTAEFYVTKDDKVVDRGQCPIDGHKLVMLFNAEEKGRYKVVFTYTIAAEKLIDSVSVEVV